MASSTDCFALQMPNRPLKRGENLLEIWEKSSAIKKGKKKEQQRHQQLATKKKSTAVDIAALIGPQKLGQWIGQIAQADSFGDYLDNRFTYLEELNQGMCILIITILQPAT